MIFQVVSILVLFSSFIFPSDSQERAKTPIPYMGDVGLSQSLELTLVWQTDTLLTTVESVIYDSVSNLIYTANINGHFMDKDQNGFISKVNLAGEIVQLKWIIGLDAPTGLGIYQGKLYTTDIDKIVEIDISSGTIEHIYPVEKAVALNDIAIGEDGTVYSSDTGGNQIFALKDGKVTLIKDNIDTPNGLLVQEDQLLVTQWTPRKVSSLDLATQSVTPFAGEIKGPDGLEAYDTNSYLVSGFDGQLYLIRADGKKILCFDTSQDQLKAADIDFIRSKNLILVPTMTGNKIMAYRVEKGKTVTPPERTSFEWLERMVDSTMEVNHIPALSVGIIFNEELVYDKGFGVLDRDRQERITTNSIFQIGSLTKMFTGLIAQNLIVAGKLNPDQTIPHYLPSTFNPSTEATLSAVTVKHLLHHTSGLPRTNPSDTRGWAEPMRGFSEERLLGDLRDIQLQFEPGTKFSYSNFGYGVLGLLCEKVSGLSYEELIKKYITEKYSLSSTFLYPDESQLERIAAPYDPHNRNRKLDRWDMGKKAPSGGIYSTTQDLAHLMKEQMSAYKQFKASGDRDMLVLTSESDNRDEYGYGFIKTVKDYGTFYNHKGDMSGFASSYIFRQEDNFGLILLTSSGGNWFQELEDALLEELLAF